MSLALINAAPTMSTREVADLIGKQHSNIKISAERLAASGVIGTLAPQEFTHNGNTYTEYRLCKRDSLILVAQNCPEFTARIVDRWQELEDAQARPAAVLPDFTDPAAAAEAWASEFRAKRAMQMENEAQAKQLEAAKPAVEFVDRFVKADGLKGFREVCKLLKANEARFTEFVLDRKIMYRLSGRLTAFQAHIDAKRFQICAGVSTVNEHAYTATKFTPRGVEWVAGEWAKYKLSAASRELAAEGQGA